MACDKRCTRKLQTQILHDKIAQLEKKNQQQAEMLRILQIRTSRQKQTKD